MGMIRRTISYKFMEILLPLYMTLVRPLVEYCVPAWSSHYSKDKILLEKIQHRFTSMIPGLKNLGYSARLDVLCLWSLEEWWNPCYLIELFKMFKGLTKIRDEELFERSLNSKMRGHSLKLRKQHWPQKVFLLWKSFVSRWNLLDANLSRP